MSEIKAGDLAVVVHSCCDTLAERSNIFGVPSIVTGLEAGHAICPFCWWTGDVTFVILGAAAANRDWVKRIPPLEELDDVKRDETIEA